MKRSDDQLYTLPEVSDIRQSRPKTEISALLREAHSLTGAAKRLKEIKDRLTEIIQEQGLANDGRLGVRDGPRCVIIHWQDGKRSLNRELLVEAGVTIEQLEAGLKQGAGSWVCELPLIGSQDAVDK